MGGRGGGLRTQDRASSCVRSQKPARQIATASLLAHVLQALRLEDVAAQSVLNSCQVVAATCIGAGDVRLQVSQDQLG